MTVRIQQGIIVLEGDCPSGEAEELLQLLLSDAAASVDWRQCDHAHSAVIQVLLAARRSILGPPRGAIATSLIGPALTRAMD